MALLDLMVFPMLYFFTFMHTCISMKLKTNRNSVSAPKLTYNAVSVRFRLWLQYRISHTVSAATIRQTTETGVSELMEDLRH